MDQAIVAPGSRFVMFDPNHQNNVQQQKYHEKPNQPKMHCSQAVIEYALTNPKIQAAYSNR